MIITKLKLRNFGPFLGEHSLDFSTTPERPLVLIGALNGGGKTTILEAARLTLFGPECGNGKLRNMKYNDYLKMCINNRAEKGCISSTEITFMRNEEGVSKEIRVSRAWSSTGDNIDETVSVFVNGDLDDSLSNESGWNSYMSTCLPPKLAHLFLFDGEQILQGGAEGVKPVLKNGIYTLLGIELIDKLVYDLELFEKKQLSELVKSSVTKELKSFEKKVSDLKDEIQDIEKKLEKANEEVRINEFALSSKRIEFRANGGEEYIQRESTLNLLNAKKAELVNVNSELAELCSMALNLKLVKDQLIEIEKQAKFELENREAVTSINTIKSRDQLLTKEILSKDNSGLSLSIINWLENDLSQRLSKVSNIKLIGYDTDIVNYINTTLSVTLPNLILKTESLLRDQAEVENLISTLEVKINQIPSEEYINKFELEIKEKELALAATVNRRNEYTHELTMSLKNLADSDAELRKFKLENIDAEAAESEAGRLQRQTEKAISTLRNFKAKLISENITLIQSLIEESLLVLLRKLTLVKKLTINPGNFEIELQAPDGRIIQWQQLSAGEQQIVTTAIIWGLARSSGLMFPMIIDTPLARLDKSHRSNILEQYYPVASHQVVLLSTDEEIGPTEFAQIESFVTRAYQVRHNEQTKVSDIIAGYFN